METVQNNVTAPTPIILKRYQNRKVYNTNSHTYVTLAEISDLVIGGQNIQVIDNKTKDDITFQVLFQVRNLKDKGVLLGKTDAVDLLYKAIRS